MKYRSRARLTLFLLVCWWAGALAFGKGLEVEVTGTGHAIKEAPVSVTVPAAQVPAAHSPHRGETPAQAETVEAGKVRLTWIVRDLKPGEKRAYRLAPAALKTGSGVELKPQGKNLDVLINGNLFTRYDATTGPNKPYFYPLNGPNGKSIVRHWPMKEVEGESRDHPHHRGLWFTHGEVNGVDFWTEGKGKGQTVHTGYGETTGGPVYGRMIAHTDWITPDGKKIAEDEREVTVYPLKEGRLMDFAVTLKATEDLTLGDTKEGTFALRLADTMRANAGRGKVSEGHILNAEGVKDGATWGKASPWVDYYGPVEGETVGVAIFDHTANLRHPTTWHVRDYGLFAANPFGLHDFNRELRDQPEAGTILVPKGKEFTLRYRLYFHNGDTSQSGVEEAYRAYATPPAIKVKP